MIKIYFIKGLIAIVAVLVTILLLDVFFIGSFDTNSLTSYASFFITIIGFSIVAIQIFYLGKQVNLQKEQHHKDSEFRNFLDATKMLASVEKDNVIVKVSAMYLLYDFAKQYPDNNLEKVIKVLNKFALPLFYPKMTTQSRRGIDEWKENGNAEQQIASIALDLVKNLFVYAIENNIKIDISGIILFNFDIKLDIKNKTNIKLSEVLIRTAKVTFLWCNFLNNQKSSIDFSSNRKYIDNFSTSRFNITLSTFIHCNLTDCDFSESNLWGVEFEKCNLTYTKFNQAECEGVTFIDNKITDEQLENMLFSRKNNGDFSKFSEKCKREPDLRYGIIYENNPHCFKNLDEYMEFKKMFFRKH